jgi:hypothetical protein
MGCDRGEGKGHSRRGGGRGPRLRGSSGGRGGGRQGSVEFDTEGVRGVVRAVAKFVGDVPASGRGEELVGREGAVLASQPEEGDGSE